MLVMKEFINALIKIVPDNVCKIRVEDLLCDGTYHFTYDVKIMKLGEFFDPEIFHIDNFQISTSVVIKMQLQSWNFKPKGATEVMRGYSYKPIGLYQI